MESSKVKALHYFIKEATVGELDYILEDISNIIGNKDFINEPEIIEALRTYHETHLNHHTLPNGQEVVVSEHGRRENELKAPVEAEGEGDASESNPGLFTYVDEARNTRFTVDVRHEVSKCKVIDDSEKHADEAVQGFKETLVESLDKYLSECYKAGTARGTVSMEGSGTITAHIEISCHNLSHKNFWGGEWLSKWTVTHTIGSTDYNLSGSIKIVNHYFEQGNIQFKLDKSFDSLSKQCAQGNVSENILEQISNLEEKYQASLEEMYEEISDNHMKNLRRKLPFTGKAFDWGVPKIL
jgi:hypothetical protein